MFVYGFCVFILTLRGNNIIVVVNSCKLTTRVAQPLGLFVSFLRYNTIRHCGIGGRRDNFPLFLNLSYKKVFYRLAFDCVFVKWLAVFAPV